MIGWIVSGAVLYFASTVVSDGVHWALAPTGWCKDHKNRVFIQAGVQITIAILSLVIVPVLPVFLAVVGTILQVLYATGFPPKLPDTIPSPRSAFFADSAYHAMHRAFPERYFGSVTTVFDALFATGCALKGRHVVMTGASGAFGAPFMELLLAKGADQVTPLKFRKHYLYGEYGGCDAALADADILVLAHGAKGELAMQANCDSFIAFIERFKELTKDREVPPEVWAVGSEIEAHPAWGKKDLKVYLESKRAYARHARRYFWDRDILYRHIVPSAFSSPMGPGLISGRLAARWAWFLIARGFRYVPVSYTGIALVNYFKFLFRVRAKPELTPGGTRRAP